MHQQLNAMLIQNPEKMICHESIKLMTHQHRISMRQGYCFLLLCQRSSKLYAQNTTAGNQNFV